ncbi:hypothetical protein Fmac_019485 [Flemingia macrophylla]|uniref:GIR1-like zinc ribbon domain-containing protein n=1 Tax=Flemingia macrophylla TaxID=520843 RepID=A0ABD1M7Y3_9FABA
MCKRKSPGGMELGSPRRPTSPGSAHSSSGEWLEFSSSSFSSSESYSSKMPSEGTSVLSSEAEDNVQPENAHETKAMPLVGCPRCFMYVMLSEVNPKCPKCSSTVFLEFFKPDH